MPRRYEGLTFREHLVLGSRVDKMRNQIMDTLMVVSAAYGKTAKATQLAWKLYYQIDSLKSELDCRVCGETPRSVLAVEGVPVTRAYYGWWHGPDGNPDRRMRVSHDVRAELTEAAAHLFDDGNPWMRDDPA